ncbi:c-type cytochrome, partial [Arcobacter sp. YIC-464]
SQIGQWNEETLDYNKKFEAKWQNPSQETLEAMGSSLYLVQCAPCHGVDAEGINGKAHNLTKRMAKEQVLDVINNGANNLKSAYPGGMPAGMASGADAVAIAEYVANGFQGEQPASYAVCAGCHGVDGKGMPYVAPNIREYDDAIVMAVLKDGKKGSIGVMPSFDGRLNETQQKALAAYLRSLGE